MSDFFCNPAASDDIYRHIVEGPTPQARGAREFTNELWSRTAPYLDSKLLQRAETQFHQSFWEMYLVAVALDLGLPVKPRRERRFANRGPDLQIGDVDAWIEAVAVTPGVGDDAVPTAELGKVRGVPHDGIKLRLLSGLSEKRRKYESYRAKGVVRPGEPCVVAINGGLVPSARLELSIPRIVSAVFPFGMPAVRINTDTGEIVESFHVHQGEVHKARGAMVSTSGFLSTENAVVSAVVYASADIFNHPSRAGLDFVLVHNPNCTDRLPRGFIKRGLEYWKEGEQLHWSDHDAKRDDA